MFKLLREFKSLWHEDIIRRRKTTPFIIFFFFLVTFIITRIVASFLPNFHLIMPYHFHHFYLGIALLIASCWIALVGKGKWLMRICAAILGIGLGFIFDEIGMMLICGTAGTVCDPNKLYWARFNYDIIMYVIIAFLLIIYFKPFWLVFRRRILGAVYKPWRVYHKVEKQLKKEIEKGHKRIRKEIEKRI